MAKAGPISRAIVAMTGVMPRWFVRYISRRYVAGSTLEDAVRVMHRLSDQGACFTIDVLGEEITSLEEATFFLEEYRRVMAKILEHGFDANLSIKPTAFGLLIDEQAGLENIRRLVQEAAEHDMFVRLDMEDHRVTDATIDVVLALHAEGLVNVGTVLQGRLHRTLDDIDRIAAELGVAADHRICKGIYLEPESIAHTSRRAISEATVASVVRSLERGAYVGIASHDDAVINASLEALAKVDGPLTVTWIPANRHRPPVLGRARGMSSKCCSVCAVLCAEACGNKATGHASTSPTEKSGTNTASAV